MLNTKPPQPTISQIAKIGNSISLKNELHPEIIEDYKLKFKNPGQELLKAQMKYFITANVPKYVFTPGINKVIDWLCSQKGNGSFILHGSVGTGKSLLLKIISAFFKYRYYWPNVVFAPVYKIYEKWQDFGDNKLQCLFETPILVIDDIGLEEAEYRYGNKKCLVSEIVYRRYDQRLLTIFSTNCSWKQLSMVYNQRVISRLVEMCEWDNTGLIGNDLRINKTAITINDTLFEDLINVYGKRERTNLAL